MSASKRKRLFKKEFPKNKESKDPEIRNFYFDLRINRTCFLNSDTYQNNLSFHCVFLLNQVFLKSRMTVVASIEIFSSLWIPLFVNVVDKSLLLVKVLVVEIPHVLKSGENIVLEIRFKYSRKNCTCSKKQWYVFAYLYLFSTRLTAKKIGLVYIVTTMLEFDKSYLEINLSGPIGIYTWVLLKM